MTDAEEPRWDDLPYHPQRFFGLADGYDRRDLKRAYNQLLRRYKPDKHPALFEKIRAAYEALNSDFQFNSPEAAAQFTSFISLKTQDPTVAANEDGSLVNDHTNSIPESPYEPHQAEKPYEPPWERLKQQIEQEAPKVVYDRLGKKLDKTPFDYYALAVLSDAFHRADEMVFYRWILSGIKQHPHDLGLLELLEAYFRTDEVPLRILPTLLPALSRVVTTDRFYLIAAIPLRRLLTSLSWNEFDKVFQQCAANIRDHQLHNRVWLANTLLRRIIWMAPPAVAQSWVDLVEQHAEILWGANERDFELVSQLMEYIHVRAGIKNRDPVTRQIDMAMQTYCTADGQARDAAVIECQTRLARNPTEIYKFLPSQDETQSPALLAWLLISAEVEQNMATPSMKHTPDEAEVPILRLLKLLDEWSPLGMFQILNTVVFGLTAGGVFLIFSTGLFIASSAQFYVHEQMLFPVIALTIGLGIVAIIFFLTHVRVKTIGRVQMWCNKKLTSRIYQRYWRDMIQRFFTATHMSYGDYGRNLQWIVQKHHDDLNVSTWMPHLYAADTAMIIYATAVRFLR